MTNEEIKQKIIEAGIKNLKEFGYPNVNKESIFTDELYAAFFENMIADNIGKSTKQVDEVLLELQTQLNTQ